MTTYQMYHPYIHTYCSYFAFALRLSATFALGPAWTHGHLRGKHQKKKKKNEEPPSPPTKADPDGFPWIGDL